MDWLKKHIRRFLMNHSGLRMKVRKVHVAEKRFRYRRSAGKVKVDDHLILFETFMGRQYGDNPRAIYERMIADPRFDGFRYIWVLMDKEKKDLFPQLANVETVDRDDWNYYDLVASAKYVITNSNLDYGITKREGQVFLQTWHGTPLKRLRCDIQAEHGNAINSIEEIHMRNDLDAVRYDYFLSPSPFATEKFTSAFDLKKLGKEDILVETGYPRNDLLYNYTEEDAARIREELDIPEGKKVILYAPTFRDNRHDGGGYVYDLHLDMDRLQREFGEEYVMLFRVHYFVANSFDFSRYSDFVRNVSGLDDISPLYTIADILITDYSSVFFDYANLRRPMIFYMYDKEDYAGDIRGFYLSLDELPGPIVTTEEELCREIRRASIEPWQEKYDRFNEKYNPLDDGHASERVIDILFGDRL
ncbi:MAG: CDP-glycerol glycerophosphotransferase family protein [Firmicutes bacterium]|nr:CDP-glycerol glycerophosphotransferase family protein [Bacillota bacterium]